MNHSRILRVTNILLLLNGYQLHWFAAKSQRFRFSLAAVLNLAVFCIIYIACFAQHFEQSALLKMLEDLSPFLYGLVRMQLLLGIKVLVYGVYASVRATGAANGILEQLQLVASTRMRALAKAEWAAYGLLLSTWCVLLGFGLYIAIEMKFKLPPLDDIMIGLALFLPHFMLGGALRFYNIFAWLCRGQLQHLAARIDEELSGSSAKQKSATELVAASTSLDDVTVVATAQLDAVAQQKQQLELLATRLAAFFEAMKGSLLLLFGMHTNCLLAGIYSYVYYSNIWHVMFEPRKRRIFYASNFLIYACICCDYVCLLTTQTLLQQQVTKLGNTLGLALSQSSSLPKKVRSTVKQMRNILANLFSFRLSSLWRFNVANFVLVQIIEGLIIALIVLYHYFNDAIVQINVRLDSDSDE